MLVLALFTALLGLIFLPARTDAGYVLSQNQQTIVAFAAHRAQPQAFETASEAAYAAALKYYRPVLPGGEIGAKIYVDLVGGFPRYTFGLLIPGMIDPVTSEPEVTYSTRQSDGHLAVVGLWHEHPTGTLLDSLVSHFDEIQATKQVIWTSIGTGLFVQYWDGAAAHELQLIS